jgi:hypothetical protein
MNAAEISDQLGQDSLRQRNGYIENTCAPAVYFYGLAMEEDSPDVVQCVTLQRQKPRATLQTPKYDEQGDASWFASTLQRQEHIVHPSHSNGVALFGPASDVQEVPVVFDKMATHNISEILWPPSMQISKRLCTASIPSAPSMVDRSIQSCFSLSSCCRWDAGQPWPPPVQFELQAAGVQFSFLDSAEIGTTPWTFLALVWLSNWLCFHLLWKPPWQLPSLAEFIDDGRQTRPMVDHSNGELLQLIKIYGTAQLIQVGVVLLPMQWPSFCCFGADKKSKLLLFWSSNPGLNSISKLVIAAWGQAAIQGEGNVSYLGPPAPWAVICIACCKPKLGSQGGVQRKEEY